MNILGHCVDLISCIKSRKCKQGFPFDNFDFCDFKRSDEVQTIMAYFDFHL